METFNMNIIYVQVELKRIHKRCPTDKIYTNCSMNKQNVKGDKKTPEKAILEIGGQ